MENEIDRLLEWVTKEEQIPNVCKWLYKEFREQLMQSKENLHKSVVIKSVCPKCKSESVTKASGNNWCDDCGNVWRQTV